MCEKWIQTWHNPAGTTLIKKMLTAFIGNLDGLGSLAACLKETLSTLNGPKATNIYVKGKFQWMFFAEFLDQFTRHLPTPFQTERCAWLWLWRCTGMPWFVSSNEVVHEWYGERTSWDNPHTSALAKLLLEKSNALVFRDAREMKEKGSAK